MRLKLRKFGEGFTSNPTIVDVEFQKVPHQTRSTYIVKVDGKNVGHIHQVLASTDRQYNRIRVPGKGRLMWGWRSGMKTHYPGLYCTNRMYAVAQMLGYDDYTEIKEG